MHEPIHQQLTRLGLRGAADALARLPLDDDTLDALALLLESECLHRDSLGQARRLKLAKLSQRAHPADVDLRSPRGLGKTRWQQLLSLNWFKQHQHLLLAGVDHRHRRLHRPTTIANPKPLSGPRPLATSCRK